MGLELIDHGVIQPFVPTTTATHGSPAFVDAQHRACVKAREPGGYADKKPISISAAERGALLRG